MFDEWDETKHLRAAPTLRLTADDLRSKWGFRDGDLLSDWGLRDPTLACPESLSWHNWKHQVLIRLVRKHLLPLMPLSEVEEIGTHHNPIRIVDWHKSERLENPVTVDVTPEQIEQAALDVEAEWRAASAS